MRSLFWLLLLSSTAFADLNVCPKVPVASAVTHQWINAISSSSAVTQSQPAFTDISGSVAATQMPAFTGDITTSAGTVNTTLSTTIANPHTFTGDLTLSGAGTGLAVTNDETIGGALTSGNYTLTPTSAVAETINRIGSGTGNAEYWGLNIKNAGNSDSFIIGQTSSAYTTGGGLSWIGNSTGFFYYPTTLKFGTGAGATPTMTLNSSGAVQVNTNLNVIGAVEPFQTDFTATGTTTVNASASVVGVSTLFLTELAIGDRISLSSAATTYRTVTAIADNTHLTLSNTIGNNTAGTTINVKKAIVRGNDSLGVNQFFVADNGAVAFGPTINWTSTAAAGGAQGFVNVVAPIATNTYVGLQFNSDSRLIMRRANGTVSASSQGVGNVISAPTKVLSGQVLGNIGWQGYNEVTNSFVVNTSTIAVTATEDYTGTANGSKMEFSTTPNGAVAAAIAVKIDQDKSTTLNGAFLAPNLASSSAATTGTLCWTTGTGNVNVDTSTTCLLSTRKIKQDIEPLDAGIETVMKLEPISYQLKPEHNPAHLGRQVGFISEDVGAIDDRLISHDDHGDPMGVRYQQLTAVLTKAIQQQQHEIEMLKAQVKKLRR